MVLARDGWWRRAGLGDGRAIRRTGLAALLGLLALALVPVAAPAGESAPAEGEAMGFFLAPQVKRYLRSHTSYQFGSPYEVNLNPLSRLEFPLNSWWAGVNLGLKGPSNSLELELLAALPGQDDLGQMRDSDWDDNERPKVRTIYSESTTKLKDSFTLDAKVTHSLREPLGLPSWLDLRPLMGVRWQRFVFVTHDGMQQSLVSAPGDPGGEQWEYLALPGDGLLFRQEYQHAYAGLLVSADLGRLGLGRPGSGWRASVQADLAQVWGQNRDHHLLRAGQRITEERTQGHAWHTALSLRAPLGGWGSLVGAWEHLVIQTRGEHTLSSTEPELLLTFDRGVEVWSRQMSLSLALEIEF